MTSLTLATLDNEAVENNTEQINKLFPKCRPRSDINLNPIIHHPQQHHQQQFERTTADNSPIHLINADRSSDRIIEIAGGREIYSQNRIKAARKSRGSTAVATVSIAATNGSNLDVSIINKSDIEQSHETSSIAKSGANSSKHYTHIYKSPTRHNGNVWELRAKEIVGANAAAASAPPQSQKVREPSSAGLTETVFSSVVVMTKDLDDNTELDGDKSVAVAQDKINCPGDGHSTGDGTVVVFDDIDENNGCWYNQRRCHDDNLVDVLMHNEQSEQQLQHQQRMYHHHHHRPQNNGLDLRIDLADGDMTSIQSNQHIYQNDNILQDVQREENRAGGAQKVIGNLPIAVYEGSPRRYGSYRHPTYNDTVIEQRDVSPIEGVHVSVSVNTCPPLGRNSSNSSSPGSSISSSAIPKRDRLDESHSGNTGNYGHGSNVVYMPRPGFPQRVIYSSTVNSGGIIRSSDSMRSSTQYADKQSQSNMTPGGHSRNSPTIEEPANLSTSAISTTVTSIPSTTFDYLYEFSETRKVLEEFFKCPGPPDINTATEDTNDHLDLDLNLDIDTDTLTVGQYTQCGGTNAIGNDRSDLDNDDGVGMDDYDLGTVGKLNFEFQELEYELRRQARSSGTAGMGLLYVSGTGDKDAAAADNSLCEVSGNAYVGQRLAKGRIETGDGAEFCEASPSPIKQMPHEQDVIEHENNFLDLSIGTGSSGDLGETEVGLQVGHSRNFTLSPETTDCDSNCGDLDSEVSLMLMDNELGPPSGFLGSSGDLVLPGDSLRLYSSMPVLEDGLSSGHASDTDNNNPTVRLMKKQITEIERELSGAQTQTTTTGAKAKHGHQHENGSMVGIRGSLTPKNESASPMNGCSSNSYESNHLSAMDSLEKTPPPPAPVPHRCDSGISSGEIDSVGHNPTNLMVLPTSLVASGNNSSGKSNCSSSSISANNGVGVGVSGNSTNNVVVLMDTNMSTISANSVVGGAGSNSNSVVEAAIKDIRLTLQRTKTLPLKCHNGVGLTVNGQSGEDLTMVEACSSPNGLTPGNRLVDTLGVSTTAAASSTVDCEHDDTNNKDVRDGINMTSPVWVPRQREISTVAIAGESDHKVPSSEEGGDEEEADTDLETDRLLGQQRTDDQGFYDEKEWRNKPPAVTVAKCRTLLSAATSTAASTLQAIQQHYSSSGSAAAAGYLTSAQSLPPLTNHHHFHHHTLDDDDLDDDDLDDGDANDDDLDDDDLDDDKAMSLAATNTVVAAVADGNADVIATIAGDSDRSSNKSDGPDQQGVAVTMTSSVGLNAAATATTTAKPKKDKESKKKSRNKEGNLDSTVLIEGVLFRARYLGSTQLVCEGQPTKTTRMMQAEEAVSRIKFLGSVEVDEEAGRKRRKRLKKNMVEVAVTKIKAPDGETQPSTEVDLFISTEKIMVLNTDLKEIMMDHALRTISYIADIGDLVVLMARRRFVPHELEEAPKINRTPKMICHVFESEEAQFIAQSIGQAFQVAYMEFLKANGIEDHSFVKEMDYQEVLNSQEIFGDELQMFAKKEMQKEVVVPKAKGEILGVVIVESGWGSMLPTVVIANLAPAGAAARCGQLNIGDQIIAINGVSLVGLPLSTCQTYIKNSKNQTVVKLTVVPCAPVVEVKIKRPDTKYQLGFSVQNGVICSLLRGGIAERGGVRVGHRIIEINNQSVVAVPHEKIVNLLATSVGEILMKTMPTSMFRLLTGQENPVYI